MKGVILMKQQQTTIGQQTEKLLLRGFREGRLNI
jgi:hypothetical protein